MTTKTRAELRSAIFSSDNMKPKTALVDFFGEEVEVRQPSMDVILSYREAAEKDRKDAMVDMMISYVYVPGSDEKVFEVGDKDNLLQMPFGADYTRLQVAISKLTDVDLQTKDAAKN